MKKEKSCGCIIIRDNKVLLVYERNRDFWGFPKGHVENNETEIETALREVKEEVGLDVNINPNKRYTMNYIINNEIDKTTVLFLAMTKNSKIKRQVEEIEKAEWVEFDKVLEMFKYKEYKDCWEKVIKDIKKQL